MTVDGGVWFVAGVNPWIFVAKKRDVMDGFTSVFVVSMLSLFICYIIRMKYISVC